MAGRDDVSSGVLRGVELSMVNGDEIEGPEAAEQEVGYTTRLLMQTLFPYRKPDVDKVIRQQGPLRVTALSANGLPYGKYPRLIMIYLCTEAVRRRELPEDEARRIPLGSSMQRFLHEIGVLGRATGGARGTLSIMHEQLRRLASTMITVEKLYEPGSESARANRATIRNLGMFDSMDFWFPTSPDQLALSEPFLELTQPFFQEITENPVPVDLNIVRQLGQPRAIDVYLWATFKKFSIRTPFMLSWDQAQRQFGPEMAETARGRADFKKSFSASIERVQELWPEAGLAAGRDGVALEPGQPSVRRRPSKTISRRPGKTP